MRLHVEDVRLQQPLYLLAVSLAVAHGDGITQQRPAREVRDRCRDQGPRFVPRAPLPQLQLPGELL